MFMTHKILVSTDINVLPVQKMLFILIFKNKDSQAHGLQNMWDLWTDGWKLLMYFYCLLKGRCPMTHSDMWYSQYSITWLFTNPILIATSRDTNVSQCLYIRVCCVFIIKFSAIGFHQDILIQVFDQIYIYIVFILYITPDIALATVYFIANMLDEQTELAILNIVYEKHDLRISFLCEDK